MTGLPEGYTTRAPSREDAEDIAALISACQITDTGETDVSVEELLDDWRHLDLAEEAVLVAAPEGAIAAYADVINRSFVTVSVYGYVHPDYRGVGLGAYLVAWGERWTRGRMPQALLPRRYDDPGFERAYERAAADLDEWLRAELPTAREELADAFRGMLGVGRRRARW